MNAPEVFYNREDLWQFPREPSSLDGATGAGDTPEIGSTLALRAEVELPGLTPGDVQVQAAYGRVDDTDGLHDVECIPMEHEQVDGSRHWFTATVPLERTGAFGYTVRVLRELVPASEREKFDRRIPFVIE